MEMNDWHGSIIAKLREIHSGKVNGRQAVFSVCEMQTVLHEVASACEHNHFNDVNNVIDKLASIVRECCKFIGSASHNEQLFQNSVPSFELIPVTVSTISFLRKRCHIRKFDVTILTELLSLQWPLNSLTILANLVCDLYPCLRKHHFNQFKV